MARKEQFSVGISSEQLLRLNKICKRVGESRAQLVGEWVVQRMDQIEGKSQVVSRQDIEKFKPILKAILESVIACNLSIFDALDEKKIEEIEVKVGRIVSNLMD